MHGESIKSRLLKWRFNFFPAYRRCGARITFISDDFHEVRIKLLKHWNNVNHVGTIWGGSLYGAIDPVYTLMLSTILGKEYFVIDKSANIQFRRMGSGVLTGRFILPVGEIDEIVSLLKTRKKIDREYNAQLVNDNNEVIVEAKKVIHVRRK